MKKKKNILFVTQEITPYLPDTKLSKMGRYLPQKIQEKGNAIRTFMPKYGCIKERRNQLHEVIRLSGMNLIINNNDHPLTIKVASIQTARMQVYFIDNEDYFGRKHILKDETGEEFSDNDERIIFFARGVIETIKKLNWSPDLIHCIGWVPSLIPLYIKKSYYDDPLFSKTKMVYSIIGPEFHNPFRKNFKEKVLMEGIEKNDLELLNDPTFNNLNKLAINMSDGIVKENGNINNELETYLEENGRLTFEHNPENDDYGDDYMDFYNKLFE